MKSMKSILLVLIVGCLSCLSLQAQKKCHISAEIQGFTGGDMIYFDFMEKDGINQEFPYKENQLMEFDVELDDITMMKINAWVIICLEPGDNIHAKVTYVGNRYDAVEYTGTPRAVVVADYLHKVRALRAERKYKTNIPAMMVLLYDAKEHYTATLKEWQDEIAMLDEIKGEISPRMYNYLLSEMEATLLTNLISYPYACSSYQKKKLEDCMADGYWGALDNYRLRDDEASLRNRPYMGFLGTYKNYELGKKAHENSETYTPAKNMEDEYGSIVAFYDGTLRDAALFVFLYNQVAGNKDFATVEKLKKDYLKKYNKNKEYKKILADVMK